MRPSCCARLLFMLVIAMTLGVAHLPQSRAQAESSAPMSKGQSHSPFAVPAAFRARVDFWIDIFTRYGKEQVVLHHKYYPYVIFDVLDFSAQAAILPPIALEKYKEQVRKKREHEIREALQRLSAGLPARSELEQHIVSQMEAYEQTKGRYRLVLTDELVRGQQGISEQFMAALKRSGRYLPMMESVFREKHLPIELTRLPFVESAFDYTARSSVGAVGLWQFMRSTGRNYLRISSAVDERRDPVVATRAAALYLQQAYGQLGSWPLALTSYNHGVAGVSRKVREAGTSNLVALVESREKPAFGVASSNFYASFLAALEVHANYSRYFPGLQIEEELRFQEVRLATSMSVQAAASRYRVSVAELKQLNYAILEPTWQGRYKLPAGFLLRLPRGGAAPQHEREVLVSRAPRPNTDTVEVEDREDATATTYVVRRGDNLGSIAHKHGLSVALLKELNDLSSSSIRVGQRLIVDRQRAGGEEQAGVARVEVPPVKRLTHRVKRGDTLFGISRQYGIQVKKLQRLNGLTSNQLRVGQLLVVREGE